MKQFKIQDSLSNNSKFICLDSTGIIVTIQKDDSEFTPYFNVNIVRHNSINSSKFFVDSIVYNSHTKELTLLNTRNTINSVVASSKISTNDIISVYSFGKEKDEVLIVVDKSE